MADNLVIVESPAKAKTIEKFLGKDFEVRASMGHVLDLPKNGLGVNTRGNFEPKYVIIEKKEKLIQDLQGACRRAKFVYLAPDPDREGEAIASHLATVLELTDPYRAVFNEITKSAVREAMAHPRRIDTDLVDAQQARRVLDRLVGYKISPLLWRKVQRGTSAGRVQSVALRLIVDREAEIDAFKAEEYWSLVASLSRQKHKKLFSADFIGTAAGDKMRLGSQQDVVVVLQGLDGQAYTVRQVETKQTKRQPQPPYITSTLQQDGSNRLRMTSKRTMRLAQELYEGVDMGALGDQGLITYMRTDSTRISEEAQHSVRQYIEKTFGKPYVGHGRQGKKKDIQDAHEAIRPTDVFLTPDRVKSHLSSDLYRLYHLIWQRFVASFMQPATFDSTRADIVAGDYLFRANGLTLTFPGYLAVWPRDEDKDTALPPLAPGETLEMHNLTPEQHFTQPPPRYNEASLIKELEERGIGRPSTYAPIVSTIQDRGYVEMDSRRFMPTWLGTTVAEVMKKHFADVIDISFTARMEKDLDRIEEGDREWIAFLKDFYQPFKASVDRAEAEMDRVQRPVEETDEICPLCGRPLVIKMGRFGRFLSCSGYPECTHRASYVIRTGATCPLDGGDIVERRTKKGNSLFYGCRNYPACTFAVNDRPLPNPCPVCGGLVAETKGSTEPHCIACHPELNSQPASRRRRAAGSTKEPAAAKEAAAAGVS